MLLSGIVVGVSSATGRTSYCRWRQALCHEHCRSHSEQRRAQLPDDETSLQGKPNGTARFLPFTGRAVCGRVRARMQTVMFSHDWGVDCSPSALYVRPLPLHSTEFFDNLAFAFLRNDAPSLDTACFPRAHFVGRLWSRASVKSIFAKPAIKALVEHASDWRSTFSVSPCDVYEANVEKPLWPGLASRGSVLWHDLRFITEMLLGSGRS